MSLALADTWAVQRSVPLVDVVQAANKEAGASREDVRQVLRAGVVKPLSERGKYGRVLLSGEDAAFLLACVILAAVAGIAVVSMAKALARTGAKLEAGGVVIPLPTAA